MGEWIAITGTVFWILVILYFLIVSILALGVGSGTHTASSELPHPEGVSVVIPFRNEEIHLPDLLADMLRQDYPATRMEIIFVDDHSTDRSVELIARQISSQSHIRCIHLPEGHSGKKMALEYAISKAKFDRIIQTDADCRVGPGFIRSHLSFLGEWPAELVAGLVTTRKKNGGGGVFLGAFERLDMLSLVGTGAGSFRYRRPLMCSGANLSYSRQLYQDTRVFDPSDRVASGDDMFLMIGARKLGRQTVFLSAREAIVYTAPVQSPADLLRQRIRWGGKSLHYQMADIQVVASLVALTNLMVLFSFVLLLTGQAGGPSFPAAILLKTMADFMLLFRTTGMTGQRSSLWWFLPVSAIYYLYFPLVLAGSLIMALPWKGRGDFR